MPRQRDAHRTVTSDKKSYQNQILVILVVRFLASTSREQRTKQTVQNCFSETPRFRELVKYVTLSYITFKIVKDRSLDQNCLHNSSSQLRRTVWGLYGARCGNVSATVHTREKRVLHQLWITAAVSCVHLRQHHRASCFCIAEFAGKTKINKN